jgi:hypothetical protein
MFAKFVSGAAIVLFVGLVLSLAIISAAVGGVFGGLAGYSSLSLLQILLPQEIGKADSENLEVLFSVGGAFVGAIGPLFLLGRSVYSELENKPSSRAKLRIFASTIQKLWSVAST